MNHGCARDPDPHAMSYILDALRKADAQRERDPSRGLHAQHLAPDGALASPSNRGLWWAGAAAFATVLVAGAAWQWSRPEPGPQASTVAIAPRPLPAAAPAPAPAPAPVSEMLPPVVARSAPAAASEISPAAPPAAPVPRAAAEVVPAAPPPAPAPRPTPRREADAAAPAMTAPRTPEAGVSTAATAPSPPSATGPSPIATEPPAGAPKLTVTGGVYSGNAAQRMLIVNGQVFNEGSEPAPGVRVEQIRPNSAVLSYQGQRFSVKY